ncbi:thioredoxin fold domain-containing protein [Pseudomonas gregormendelii]|uniref:Thioredoxin fold domain-containing protein n=1 Tax=Pseudomonas gregormendelii TaxID=1628277 RepID=A0ABS3AKU8_9PSED|nr:thioredoxin fold domain-containing protein [Pseudomonas gregormendelii]MBN3967552.1 thioredoxin fold domain-containing protein [Pseudomonas gregormendelii]
MILPRSSFRLAGLGLVAILSLTSPLAQAEGLGSFLYELTQPPVPKPAPQFRFYRDALSTLTAEDYISFSPSNPKAYVYVFADATCPFTRELHKSVQEINARGVEVRYLAAPSGELNGPAWMLYKNIWCSDNPKQTFDDAMKGKPVRTQTCSKNDLRTLGAQDDARRTINIAKTPTTFFQDGVWSIGSEAAKGLPERAILGARIMASQR